MSSRSPANSNPPQRIGPYEILRRVGAGGMGTVYKARHVELGRIVALKVLPPDLADKQEMLDRFRLEAKNAARLRHEHIVTLYEIGEANGVRYLAMEYVKGKNLHEIIHAKVRLEPEESRKLMMQAARALDQAYREGIVHRDIKPANFLLTVKDGKPFVKLTDFGLARCLEDTDFKVTRSGTTVGTVDYIAPEQARNSRQADIRSDIYSLGCTLYHMLAGQPPFPEGDMTERLLKHVEATPDDVRKFNPQVPPGIVVVLNKMLAKRPQDRYQTPQELLNDLEHLPSGPILSPRELLEALALDSVAKHKRGTATETTRLLGQEKLLPGEIPTLRYRYSRLFVRKPKNRGSEGGGSALPIVIHGWKAWSVIACVAAALLGVGTFLAMNWGNNREQRQTPEWVDNAPGSAREDDHPKSRDGSVQNDSKLNDSDRVVSSLPPSRKTEADESQGRIDPSVKAQRQRPKSWQPAVYQPPPEQLASLEKQFQAIVRPDTPVVLPGNSGVAKTEPADAQKASGSSTSTAASSRPEKPALIVSRLPFGSDGRHFDSLAAACAAAGAARAVVEIHENGPLFASPVSLGDVNLLVRAGKGYRPLLVWDIQDSTAPRSSRWFSIAGGSVSLQNLEVVVKVSDLSQDEHLSLFGTPRGEIRAENCTFSVAGRHRAGTSVIQIDPPSTAVPPGRCRLANCFIRGADVTVLDLRAAGAEATLDGCVLISSNRPLVEVIGKAGAANSIIRAVHCTLVSGQSLFRVLPASAMDRECAVRWLFWDSLLAHYGEPGNGSLLELLDATGTRGMQWSAVNCLYSGWATLLKSDTESVHQLDIWRRLWNNGVGDRVAVETWPAVVPPDPSETPAAAFRVVGTHAGFSDSIGANTLGCDISALAPAHDGWLSFTFERSAPPIVDLPPADQAPPIPDSADGLYHGERLDLTSVNLGEHLRDMQNKKKFASQVVLHLHGKGEARTGPVSVKGTNLVLFFEPPEKDAEALVLVPRNAAGHDGLIEVESGSCELLGGKIRFPNTRSLPVPQYLVKVQGGHLYMAGCQLEGPTSELPGSYRGLVHFTGSGAATADELQECAVADCVLLSGLSCIHAVGPGTRVRVQNSVLVSGSHALWVEPLAGTATRLNCQCILERNTIAAQRGMLRVSDGAQLPPVVDPVVVQAKANVFIDVFGGGQRRSGLLSVDADAFGHGLIAWQGDANVYDKQLQYYVSVQNQTSPVAAQPYAGFARLWGAGGDRRPVVFDMPWRQFDLAKPQLDRLALPEALRNRIRGQKPGADFEQLGLVKKPKKKQAQNP